MRGVESVVAEEWLVTRLAANPAIAVLVGDRIFVDSIPGRGNATFPLVFITGSPDPDLLLTGGVRVWTEGLYAVRGVARGQSYKEVAPLASAIDEALHNKSGSTADGTILGCLREQVMKMPESDNGVAYRHLGGLYRVWVQ
jgi:hypothetical protein